MHVRTDGPADAAALLLLHGFSGSLNWFDGVVPLLSDRYRVIRVDLLGHGSTGGAAADAPEQAAAVEAVLDEIGVSAVTVIGHSFGADVAVHLAEHSERVDRLVIVAQAPDYSAAKLPRGRMMMAVPVLRTVLHRFALGLGTALRAALAVRRRGRPTDGLASLAMRDFRAMNLDMFRVVIVERRDRMAMRPLDAQVAAAGKPTLVILGEHDHFYGAGSASRYRSAGAQVETLADTGHSVFIEAPDRAAQLISAFVERRTAVPERSPGG